MNDQHLNTPMEGGDDKKGAVCTSFGMILVILGALDCALAWRGSFEVSNFAVALLVGGVSLYCIGAVRAGNDPD